MSAVPDSLPEGFKVGLLCAFACSGRLITPEMVVAMSLQPPPTHLSTGFMCIKGKPIEQARELLAEAAVQAQAKYLWFVDDDTIPPPNTMRRLIYVLENNPNVMVAGGVYMTRCIPPSPCVFRGMGLGPFWRWKKGEVFEVTGMGAGCMMIKCEVFKHLTKPWFPWTTIDSDDPLVKSVNISEDINFCSAVRAAGYQVVAHGGILCDHFDSETGQTFSLPEDSYPMQPEESSSVEPPVKGPHSTPKRKRKN
jgi:hypothetical protein